MKLIIIAILILLILPVRADQGRWLVTISTINNLGTENTLTLRDTLANSLTSTSSNGFNHVLDLDNYSSNLTKEQLIKQFGELKEEIAIFKKTKSKKEK